MPLTFRELSLLYMYIHILSQFFRNVFFYKRWNNSTILIDCKWTGTISSDQIKTENKGWLGSFYTAKSNSQSDEHGKFRKKLHGRYEI